MYAYQIDEYGGAEKLQWRQVPDPVAGDGQVVVQIYATTLNPIDIKLASGVMKEQMPVSFPWTPGADFAGIVESVGEGVTDFNVGDQVYGESPIGGAYAEKIVVDATTVAAIPRSLEYGDSASFGLVAQTAWQALDAAEVSSGKTVLIHGGSGGVGTVAIQLAQARGAKVITTASADYAERLQKLGADEVIDYKNEKFEEKVKDVDAVVDGIGGDTQARSYGVIKAGGILVALNQPPSEDEAKKHNVRATMLQTQPSAENLKAVAERIDTGKLLPVVGKTFPIADAPKVWQDHGSSRVLGKIVFIVTSL